MPERLLDKYQARKLVDKAIATKAAFVSTQEILDSGEILALKGFTVKPGKVSDSIFGGGGSFKIDLDKWIGEEQPKTEYKILREFEEEQKKGPPKKRLEIGFENKQLNTKRGVPLRTMVRTERISTHDITRGDIPFKDQVLSLNHNYMRKMLAPFIGTSQHDIKGINDNDIVIAAENLEQIPFENVLRTYMARSTTGTSLYKHFMKGDRTFCGHELPDNLFANGPLPYVMDTPSTKSDEHDESLSPQEMFDRGIITPEDYTNIRNSSLVAYGVAAGHLKNIGLILVDTKLEHGRSVDGKIKSQDEIITLDSSRFWKYDEYMNQVEQFSRGEIKAINPTSYSKEFARGFSEGDKGYTDDQRAQIAVRYIMGIQEITGKKFIPDMRSREERIVTGLQKIVNELL